MKTSHLVQWLGMAISIVAVVLLVRSLQLDKVGHSFQEADYIWVIPAVFASLLSFVFRAERLRLFLASLKQIGLAKAYQYIAINYMGNNVLPARAGEVLISYVVKQQEDIAISSTLAVVILGRVIDGLLMVGVLLVTLLILPFPAWVEEVIIGGGAFFGLALVVLLWLVFGRQQDHRWVRHLLHRLSPPFLARPLVVVVGWVKEFQLGLSQLKNARTVVLALVYSGLTWVAEVCVFYCIARAVGIPVPWVRLWFTLALINLAATVPSAPASLGTFEGVVVAGLSLGGVSVNQAAVFALLVHMIQVVPITIIGAVSYARMSVGKLMQIQAQRAIEERG